MANARRAFTRASLAVGVGAGVALALAAPASAVSFASVGTTVSPSPSPSSYEPPEVPSLTAEIFEPVCDGDVPYLQYRVVPTGATSDTLTITWINPSGDDVVYTDLPLEGRVLWPGAVVDEDGNPLDWPGWRLEDGEWVEGDEFDWVRPSVDVRMEVNPEVTLTAAYPPSSPSCATNPPGTPEPGPSGSASGGSPGTSATSGLAVTGAGVTTVAAVALGLVAAGGVALGIARRRKA
jgi:hypothetical protein